MWQNMDDATGKEGDVSQSVVRIRAVKLDIIEWDELFGFRKRDNHMVEGINWMDFVNAVNMSSYVSNNEDKPDLLPFWCGEVASLKLK